jgi:hypothetical protein
MALFSPFISAPLGPVFGQTDLPYKENLGDGSDTKYNQISWTIFAGRKF